MGLRWWFCQICSMVMVVSPEKFTRWCLPEVVYVFVCGSVCCLCATERKVKGNRGIFVNWPHFKSPFCISVDFFKG